MPPSTNGPGVPVVFTLNVWEELYGAVVVTGVLTEPTIVPQAVDIGTVVSIVKAEMPLHVDAGLPVMCPV
jgi:hypothetical protein